MQGIERMGFLICGLAVFFATQAVMGNDEALKRDLRDFLKETVQNHQIVGLTIGVVKDDRVVYLDAFGSTKLDAGQPLKPENLFHFASVSKPFVATAVMQLVEQGKMSLNHPITRYLPYFKLDDPRYKDITVLHVLNHTSGMPDVDDYQWDKPEWDEGAAERFVRGMAGEKMLSDPGSKYRYSNMAFDMMGDVIAKVSGMSFEEYVKKNILAPLEMKESNFLYHQTSEDLRTSGHTWMLKPIATPYYPYNRRHAPSSTLNSSVVEMTHWMKANLNHGAWGKHRILSQKNHEILWKPSFSIREARSVGLSWSLREYRGMQTVSHNGSDDGYVSTLTMIPEKKLGVVMVSNYDNAPIGGLLKGVLDILSGYKPERVKLAVLKPFACAYLNDGLDAAKVLYNDLKTNHPHEYRFGPDQMNNLGYFLVSKGQASKALPLFHFNTELFPKDANCWDSLGACYLTLGDGDKAASFFRKALEIDPQLQSSIQALKKINQE